MTNSRIISLGINDLHAINDGWYGLEKSPERVYFRASAPLAELTLPIEGIRVDLSLYLAARPEHAGEPLEASVFNSTADSGFTFILETNGWSIRSGSVIINQDKKIQIIIKNPWSPDRLYNNGDSRSLGVLLSAVRINTLD